MSDLAAAAAAWLDPMVDMLLTRARLPRLMPLPLPPNRACWLVRLFMDDDADEDTDEPMPPTDDDGWWWCCWCWTGTSRTVLLGGALTYVRGISDCWLDDRICRSRSGPRSPSGRATWCGHLLMVLALHRLLLLLLIVP